MKAVLFLLSLSCVLAQGLEEAQKNCLEDIFYQSGTDSRKACVAGTILSDVLASELKDPKMIYINAKRKCSKIYSDNLTNKIGCSEGVYYYLISSKLIKNYSLECKNQGEVSHLDACLDGACRAQLASFQYSHDKEMMHIQADDGRCYRDYAGVRTAGPKFADCYIGILQVYFEKGFIENNLTSLDGFNLDERPSWLNYSYSPWHAKYE